MPSTLSIWWEAYFSTDVFIRFRHRTWNYTEWSLAWNEGTTRLGRRGGCGCSFVSLIQHSVVTSTWLSYFLVQRKPWGDVFLLISLATPTIFEFDFVVVLYVKRSYFAKYHSLKQYKSHLHLSKASEYLWNFFILLCLSFYFSSFSEIMFLFPLFS